MSVYAVMELAKNVEDQAANLRRKAVEHENAARRHENAAHGYRAEAEELDKMAARLRGHQK